MINKIQNFNMKVKIKRLSETAKIPTYAKHGDAGMDLYVDSIISENIYQVCYGFGVAIEIPEGHVGLVFPRSSVYKTGLHLANSVGVIDSGYRGEITAFFTKHNSGQYYKVGDRACQLIIIPYPQIEFEEGELSETERGESGYGSSGL